MGAKQILYTEEARKKILKGVHTLARTVKSTLGPAGHAVALKKSFGAPQITSDGVTIAKEIELSDPFENMGAKLVIEVANKTNDVAGDGTTTATVLAEAILMEGLKIVTAGVNPIELKRGIEKATNAAVKYIDSIAKPVETDDEIERIGTIAANHDNYIGKLFAEAMSKVGRGGIITIEEGKSTETSLNVVEGMQIDKGFISPYFITNATAMKTEFDDAYILLYEKKINNIRELLPILEKVLPTGKPMLIIAEDIEGEALTTLVLNKLQGVLNVCAIKAPGFGDRRKEMLADIAILTGGNVVSEEQNMKLETITLENLGKARRIVVDKENTTIIEGLGKPEDIEARVNALDIQIEKTDSNFDREKLVERKAKLIGGVAVIKVGGKTEVEMKETKMRVEDALNATKSAVEEGIIAGGGVSLIRAIAELDKVEYSGDEVYGKNIIASALRIPLETIASNAGFNGAVVVEEVLANKDINFGFDVRLGKYMNLLEGGVIDPAKVVKSALANAASVAGLMLTTNTMVTDYNKDKIIDEAVK